MIKPMISITLLSALASLIVGCETSNQNYSHNRVVDVTKSQSVNKVVPESAPIVQEIPVEQSMSSAIAQAPSPVESNYEITTYEPVVDPNNDIVTYTGNALPSYEEEVGPSLIGGVPDGPLPPTIANEPSMQASSALPSNQATNSTSSGNWLLVDSAEANKDVSNSQAVQRSLDNKQAPAVKTLPLPDKYVVVKGDTLYSIAFRYGLDYHALAKINKIEPPYNLALGQVLVLNLQSQRAPVYVVQKGDTLYSIARKNGQSVSFLAGVNNLEPPYNLKLGQKILLSRENVGESSKNNSEVPVAGVQSQIASNNKQPASVTTTTTTTTTTTNQANGNKTTTTTTTNKTQQITASNKVPAQAQTPIVNSKTRKVAGVTWSWPTSGKVIEQFSTAEQGNKGIDIAGTRGQAILSAADGQVVYSGNALRGFGNLIIINHNNEYLSAYAHNDVMLVKEGQKVKRGQHIARMGNTDTTSPRLHFEIRYRGQSVNPVSYLPK